jgi:hypothetical protein
MHVNEVEIEEDDGSTALVPADILRYLARNQGSSYRCGWCGITTTDWNHVLRCRELGLAGSKKRMARLAVRLEALASDLEAMEEKIVHEEAHAGIA